MKHIKRLTAIFLVVTMFMTALPISAAAETSVPVGYTAIYTAKDLDAIRNNMSGKYILMNDIDLASWGSWKPIGDCNGEFSGELNGNGHKIQNMTLGEHSLVRGGETSECTGLFGILNGATIKNISCVTGNIVTGGGWIYIGVVAGEAYNSQISRCGSAVTISYSDYAEEYNAEYRNDNEWANEDWDDDGQYIAVNTGAYVGGIVGLASDTTVEECYNIGNISGVSKDVPMFVGGIVGVGSSTICNCFNGAALSVKTNEILSYVGGIVGSNGSASYCYNIGKLSCKTSVSSHACIGGILGGGNLYSSWGDVNYTISNCYYDSSTAECVGKSSNRVKIMNSKACSNSAMQKQSTYSGFDFTNTWTMGDSDYPYPILQSANSADTVPDSVHICKTHTYTSAGGNICTVCGYVYEPTLAPVNKIFYPVSSGASLWSNYYAKSGKLIRKLPQNQPVTVKYSLVNSLGSLWYKTSDGFYIYSGQLNTEATTTHSVEYQSMGSTFYSTTVKHGEKVKVTTKIPERSGYIFNGWSVDTGTSCLIVQPGGSLSVTKDLVLEAVWQKEATKETKVTYSNLSDEVKQKLRSAEGFPQVKSYCTSCATALIMKRKQIVDGMDDKYNLFDFYDVRMSFGLTREEALNLKSASAVWLRTDGFSNFYSGDGSMTFYTAGKWVKDIGSTVNERRQKIIELLEEHPEGIVIYCNYSDGKSNSQHAIVLTEYDGETFYACDSVNVGKGKKYPEKLEDTYLFSKLGSVDAVFENLTDANGVGCVWYVSSAWYVSETTYD